MERTDSWDAAVVSMKEANCSDRIRETRCIASMWYYACVLATQSTRNPDEVKTIEVWDNLLAYRSSSSADVGARMPSKAEESVFAGPTFVGGGHEAYFCWGRCNTRGGIKGACAAGCRGRYNTGGGPQGGVYC